MLQKLSIKNIALIDSAEINFTEGLNVLSGETGAGKSVIIESLNFVLGAKADKTLIRSGEGECLVCAEFLVENNYAIKSLCSDFEIEYDDLLIIKRKFTIDGKSTIKVNGETVTLAMLKKFTSLLVDVHGQSEHYNLLKQSNQLKLIDSFSDGSLFNIKEKLHDLFIEYKSVLADMDSLGGDEASRLLRLDILNYQINEIINANIKENEEEELKNLKSKFINQEKILNALNSVKLALSDDGGSCDTLSNLVRIVLSIESFSNTYSVIRERLDGVVSELDDLSLEINSLIDDLDLAEVNVDEIEERIELIKTINRKYGGDYTSVLNYLKDARIEKDKLENFNELAQNLLLKKENLEKEIYNNYLNLSENRRKIALEFCSSVLKELRELNMDKACFDIKFNQAQSFEECKFESENGFDRIEFMFSANLGEPLKPLSMVISGGEMSRFMLSIKAQTAKYDNVSTFIFDEIDTGISGVVAKVVAEKFAKISKSVQIIAISHLPQICAMADTNLLIKKTEESGKALTNVHLLNETEKISEITRLIGGDTLSDTGKLHAIELIKNANEYKIKL